MAEEKELQEQEEEDEINKKKLWYKILYFQFIVQLGFVLFSMWSIGEYHSYTWRFRDSKKKKNVINSIQTSIHDTSSHV